jgi:hypothetical protein
MPEESNGANSPSRLDRIERIVEVMANTTADLQQDVKILLKAQIVMGEQMREGFARLTAAQQHTEERLNALIGVVDDIVRRPGSGSSRQG